MTLDTKALEAARRALDELHAKHAAKGTLPGYSIIVPHVIEAYLSASARSILEEAARVADAEAERAARDGHGDAACYAARNIAAAIRSLKENGNG